MLDIRRAQQEDLPGLAVLEKEIFSDAWSEKSLLETWNQKNAEIFIANNAQKEEVKDRMPDCRLCDLLLCAG